MLRRNKYQDEGEEKVSEDCPKPVSELDELELETFKDVYAAIGRVPEARASLAETIAKNPGLHKLFSEKHRQRAIQDTGVILADCPTIQHLPIEALTSLLGMNVEEMRDLQTAVERLKNYRVTLTEDEVKAAIDHAHVVEVMEPEEDIDHEPMLRNLDRTFKTGGKSLSKNWQKRPGHSKIMKR